MAVRRAFACAVFLALLAGCADGSGPSPATPAGLWSFSFEGPLHNFGGTLIGTCHSDFVVKIEEVTSVPRYEFESRIPLAAHPVCNGQPSSIAFPSVIMGFHQEGDQLALLNDGVDVLVTATYRSGSMFGTISDRAYEYVGSNFRATRLPGTADPNDGPVAIRVEFALPTLLVGDSLQITGSVKNGYGDRLHEEDVVWSSSDPAVASVESLGKDGGFYGTTGRVLGVSPGTAFVTARSGALADSVQITVLAPG
jgi:hypothetical protein